MSKHPAQVLRDGTNVDPVHTAVTAARQAGLRIDGEATGRGLEALIEAMP